MIFLCICRKGMIFLIPKTVLNFIHGKIIFDVNYQHLYYLTNIVDNGLSRG